MATDFLCPHCKNLLNVGENIVFSGRTLNGKEGLLFLHPELGNYTILKHPSFELEQGQVIDLHCPYCSKKLTSDRNANLAKILMKDEENKHYEIHFSRIVGQHSTYKIIGESVEIYGDDAAEYLDFLNNTSIF